MTTALSLAALLAASMVAGLPTTDVSRLTTLARVARAQQTRAGQPAERVGARPTSIAPRAAEAQAAPVYDYARAHRAALRAREALLDPIARATLTHEAFIAFKVETDYALTLVRTKDEWALAHAYSLAALDVDLATTLARRAASSQRIQAAVLRAFASIDAANDIYLRTLK